MGILVLNLREMDTLSGWRQLCPTFFFLLEFTHVIRRGLVQESKQKVIIVSHCKKKKKGVEIYLVYPVPLIQDYPQLIYSPQLINVLKF